MFSLFGRTFSNFLPIRGCQIAEAVSSSHTKVHNNHHSPPPPLISTQKRKKQKDAFDVVIFWWEIEANAATAAGDQKTKEKENVNT